MRLRSVVEEDLGGNMLHSNQDDELKTILRTIKKKNNKEEHGNSFTFVDFKAAFDFVLGNLTSEHRAGKSDEKMEISLAGSSHTGYPRQAGDEFECATPFPLLGYRMSAETRMPDYFPREHIALT
ncbi:hypothetical protein AAG570_011694 [Ranatra chinensis]|uniref:Uncharacterized protein n=1 Tax=Ranatra chinensis TaxID=642074 RepID=A0ABD0YGW8_9HEMI